MTAAWCPSCRRPLDWPAGRVCRDVGHTLATARVLVRRANAAQGDPKVTWMIVRVRQTTAPPVVVFDDGESVVVLDEGEGTP